MPTGQDSISGGELLLPPGIVLSKLFPPVVRPETVRRTDLLARLDAAATKRLVLVAAPAGYGKSTLLGAWVAERGADRPVAWVTIDGGDDDPVVLWSHIFAALRRASPGLAKSVGPEAANPSMLIDVVLRRLVNELTELPALTLILDDYHRLSSAGGRDSIAWFLKHAPPSFQLVLATRTEPQFPLAALRAHGELCELRAGAMALSADEASALLNDRLGLDLAPSDVATLVARTEGWPAGLYLAALSMDQVEDRHEFITRFEASNRHVIDFLVDEVLEGFDQDMQEFMLRIGVLERLSGPLCDAVTGEPGSSERLERLAQDNLFLIRLDDRAQWYRFHHLFAQLLAAELHRRSPELAPVLHQRATAWHRANGTIGEAVWHAFEGGDLDTAAELIEASWIHFTNASQFRTVRDWLGRFPRSTLDASVRLLLVEAWVLSLCGQEPEAGVVVATIEDRDDLSLGPLRDGFASGESSLSTLKSIFPWGDVGSELRCGRRAAELEPRESPWYPLSRYAIGLGSYFVGELVEAERSLKDAYALGLVGRQWLVVGSSLAYRSLTAAESGRLVDQHQLAEQAAAFAADHGMEDVAGEVHVALGVSLAARGRLEDALPLLERGVRVLESWAQPTELADALLRLAHVLHSLGEVDRAGAVLAQARSIVESCPEPGTLPERIAQLEPSITDTPQAGESLTVRELEVLRLLAGPGSRREIAASLFVSLNTVRSQVRVIYRKLDVSSRAEAVTRARSLGLI